MTDAASAGAILTIDLGAIQANWRLLAARLAPGAELSAVIKADAYGLGAAKVGPALHAAGCRSFFVALLDEALLLRKLLPRADIYVLGGALPGTESTFAQNRLIPVLNAPEQIALWAAFSQGRYISALHVDTGMARLGMNNLEMTRALADPKVRDGLAVRLLISHLACSDEPGHPLNAEQLSRFTQAREGLSALGLANLRTSFANSSGLFLDQAFHGDLARPGAALYGVNPCPGQPNPMAQVVHLQGKILQVREIDSPQSVGYGASWRAGRKSRIATVSVGYADGYLRSLSNRAHAVLNGVRIPLVGRVSMDLITFDVTETPQSAARPGALVDLIGAGCNIDTLAQEAGTIGYEILTSLGPRYHRVYRNPA